MRGDIRRGALDVIRAVIVYADLRGFTAMSDRVPGDRLAPMLDRYFEAMVPPIARRGGQVLKFLGDGLLATFNLDGRDRDSICSDALQSAYEMIADVAEANGARRTAGLPTMDLDIALHLGDVFYGNVGARRQRGKPHRDPVRAARPQCSGLGDLRRRGGRVRRPADFGRHAPAPRRPPFAGSLYDRYDGLARCQAVSANRATGRSSIGQ